MFLNIFTLRDRLFTITFQLRATNCLPASYHNFLLSTALVILHILNECSTILGFFFQASGTHSPLPKFGGTAPLRTGSGSRNVKKGANLWFRINDLCFTVSSDEGRAMNKSQVPSQKIHSNHESRLFFF